MTPAQFDAACRALPAVSMVVQWGGHSVYKVGRAEGPNKMFAILAAEGNSGGCTLKVSEIAYAALTELGVGQRASHTQPGSFWLGFPSLDALPDDGFAALIAASHAAMAAKLTRKLRAELGLG